MRQPGPAIQRVGFIQGPAKGRHSYACKYITIEVLTGRTAGVPCEWSRVQALVPHVTRVVAETRCRGPQVADVHSDNSRPSWQRGPAQLMYTNHTHCPPPGGVTGAWRSALSYSGLPQVAREMLTQAPACQLREATIVRSRSVNEARVALCEERRPRPAVRQAG